MIDVIRLEFRRGLFFLGMLQEFRTIFLKEHLGKAAPAAFRQIKIKGFNFKLSFSFSKES